MVHFIPFRVVKRLKYQIKKFLKYVSTADSLVSRVNLLDTLSAHKIFGVKLIKKVMLSSFLVAKVLLKEAQEVLSSLKLTIGGLFDSLTVQASLKVNILLSKTAEIAEALGFRVQLLEPISAIGFALFKFLAGLDEVLVDKILRFKVLLHKAISIGDCLRNILSLGETAEIMKALKAAVAGIKSVSITEKLLNFLKLNKPITITDAIKLVRCSLGETAEIVKMLKVAVADKEGVSITKKLLHLLKFSKSITITDTIKLIRMKLSDLSNITSYLKLVLSNPVETISTSHQFFLRLIPIGNISISDYISSVKTKVIEAWSILSKIKCSLTAPESISISPEKIAFEAGLPAVCVISDSFTTYPKLVSLNIEEGYPTYSTSAIDISDEANIETYSAIDIG